MMKQFLRVKQIADQKFQRDKSNSVLTDELNAAEKRVDLIKESCYATGKKLSSCIHRLCTATDSDKKSGVKKIPESALAQCMEEWGFSLGESSILGLTLVDYAHIQETLANDLLNYTLQVGDNVVEPLQNILNTDISKILKYRKQLTKLNSEMESAKSRYQNAQRSSQQVSGNGVANATVKVQLLKEDVEDIVGRVDQCRDSLTAEMFNLISREPEMSELFVKLCQLQLEHHRKAYFMLESALPELEAQIKSCPYQPVFGKPLEEHLRTANREIAIVIETCVCWLLQSAMEEEGLFRIGGSIVKIKKMKSAFDANFQHLIEDEKDPHNVAGVLKLYLRSLPEPLLTYDLYDQWMQATMEPDHDTRLTLLWSAVNSLPEANFKNLRYLIKFLSKLCANSDVNKMSIQNIAIVIGPNLIWPPVDECVLGMNMTATNMHSSIVDTLITYADWFFPGELEFYVSTPTTPRHIEGFPPPSLSSSQISLTANKMSNGHDSAVGSMSSSPTNSSSPKSPSPRPPIRPRKKAAPKAPQSFKNQITRSLSCSGFQLNTIPKTNTSESFRISNLSISHENLISANYQDSGFQENGSQITNAKEIPTIEPRVKSKPPRHSRNGLPPVRKSLPPVAERSRRPLERPSVPPPERPDSFSKSESMSSEDMQNYFTKSESLSSGDMPNIFTKSGSMNSADVPSSFSKSGSVSSGEMPDLKIVELDDVTISFDSSGSESYNECQMSFADDSESEEKCGKQNDSLPSPPINQDSPLDDPFCKTSPIAKLNVQTYNPSTNNYVKLNSNDEIKDRGRSKSESCKEEDVFPDEYSSSCHFTGGTPTWFDHYGDDKRHSNTLWFSKSEENRITVEDEVEDFRTIIEVGSSKQTFSSALPKSKLSSNAIKLRVNSETQDTKL